jgi:hypothetical protein
VPDGFARLKREARCNFDYAVKSREYLWNDLENTGVIDSLGRCRLKFALKPVLWPDASSRFSDCAAIG